MMEKYDVVTIGEQAGGGEYPNQDGFGWTNGVYADLATHLNDEPDNAE
jgi:alpha,alpha-trehalase